MTKMRMLASNPQAKPHLQRYHFLFHRQHLQRHQLKQTYSTMEMRTMKRKT